MKLTIALFFAAATLLVDLMPAQALAFNPQRRDCLQSGGTFLVADKIENDKKVDEVGLCQLVLNQQSVMVGALDIYNMVSFQKQTESVQSTTSDTWDCTSQNWITLKIDQNTVHACEFSDHSLRL